MLGRTNTPLYGEGLIVDANVVTGVVDDEDGIITGDFVQESIGVSSINSETVPYGTDDSNMFELSDGSCILFYNRSNGIYAWNFKYVNGGLNDLGTYYVNGIDVLTSFFQVYEIEAGKYVLFTVRQNEVVGSDFGLCYLITYTITVNLPQFVVTKSEVALYFGYEASQKPVSVALQGGCQISGSKYVGAFSAFIYYDGKRQRSLLLAVISLENESAVVGSPIIARVGGVSTSHNTRDFKGYKYCKTSDSVFGLFYSNYVDLYDISENTIGVLKRHSFSDNYSDFLVYGQNQVVGIFVGSSRKIYAKTIYMDAVDLFVSDKVLIADGPDLELSYGNLNLGLVKFENYFLLVCDSRETNTQNATTNSNFASRVYCGLFNPSDLYKIDLVKVFKSGYAKEIYYKIPNFIITNNLLYFYLKGSPNYDRFDSGYTAPVFISEVVKVRNLVISTIEEVKKFKKRNNGISGIAKTAGRYGEEIAVYVPKENI